MGVKPATFGSVFAVAEFRALWLAEAQSIAGDQLARVALTILVFARTGSAGLTALTYALTLLPDVVGGPLLSGLADRFPRRRLMVTADLLRALLVALMALPGTSFPVLAGLLILVQLPSREATTSDSLAIRRRMRSATCPTSTAVVAGNKTMNSSPPKRPTTS